MEIKHRYSLSFPLDPTNCRTVQGYKEIELSFTKSLLKSIESTDQQGCFLYGPCKISKFAIPKCSAKRSVRSSISNLDVNFEMVFKEWGNSSIRSTVTETAEAVAFHLKYAVTVGSFAVTVNGQTVKPRVSSFILVESTFKCREGYINGSDNSSCGRCIKGYGILLYRHSIKRFSWFNKHGLSEYKPCFYRILFPAVS